MEVNKIGYQANNVQTTKRDVLDKNAFLKILTVQLSNQDPMNAKDNSEYMAQMAQFTALEQTQNLNVSIEKLLVSQRVTEGSGLIGKTVGFKLGDDSYIKDTVKGVRVEGGSVYLMCESGNYFNIESVAGVGELQGEDSSSEDNDEVESPDGGNTGNVENPDEGTTGEIDKSADGSTINQNID